MRIKVEKIERSGGLWTVIDHELGYRICNSYQDSKFDDSPSHLHDRHDIVIGPCSAEDADVAFRAMVAYRANHTGLDQEKLEQEVQKHGHPNDTN